MNILMILANPFTNDPRVYNEACSLVRGGHSVNVLAWDRKKENPSREIKDGINIVRSYNTKFMDLLPYDIFRMHFWWNKGYKDALKLYNEKPFDVVHCHDLDTLPVGVKLKKELGLPLIYDAHEIWGYMLARDLPKAWADYYLRVEKNIIKHVDRIITVSKPFKKYFSEITNKPVTVIMNCKPLQGEKYEPPNNDKFTLLYIGSLGKARFLLELADVVKELPDVHCIIAGGGQDQNYVNTLKDKCPKACNVDFIGKISMEEVLPMTKKADIILCMVDPSNLNNRLTLANKQFEAMVCGRPIICTIGTHHAEITKKENVGLAVDYNKEMLRRAIIKLQDDSKLREKLGKNALEAAVRKYNWENQEKKLVKVYKDIIK